MRTTSFSIVHLQVSALNYTGHCVSYQENMRCWASSRRLKKKASLSLSNWSRGSSGPSHESMPCMPAMQSDIHTDFSVPTQLQETWGPPKGCSLEAACLRYGFMMEGICCAIDLHFDSQGSRLKALPLLYSD